MDEFYRLLGEKNILDSFLEKKLENAESLSNDQKDYLLKKKLISSHHYNFAKELRNLITENNIDFIFIKGFAVQNLLKDLNYKRNYKDLDLLVRKQDFNLLLELLKSSGFVTVNSLSPLRLLIESKFQHAIPLYHPEKKIHLDLHHSIERSRYGLNIDSEIFFRERKIIDSYPITSFLSATIICILAACRDGFSDYRFFLEFPKLYRRLSVEEKEQLRSFAETQNFFKIFLAALWLCHSKLGIDLDSELLAQNQIFENSELLPVSIGESLSFFRFQLAVREGFTAKMKYIFSRVFIPTDSDWAMKIPDSLFFLFFLIKPFKFLLSSRKN